MKKITNKMLAQEFGMSEQNFKIVKPQTKQRYLEAYKYRELQRLFASFNTEQMDNIMMMFELLKSEAQQ